MIGIELHSSECACKGTGWIGSRETGRSTVECRSRKRLVIPLDEWARLGKPRVIEEAVTARESHAQSATSH